VLYCPSPPSAISLCSSFPDAAVTTQIKITMGDCSVGLQQVLRKHNLDLDEGSHILCDAYGASYVHGDVHMQGDVRGDVTQVPTRPVDG